MTADRLVTHSTNVFFFTSCRLCCLIVECLVYWLVFLFFLRPSMPQWVVCDLSAFFDNLEFVPCPNKFMKSKNAKGHTLFSKFTLPGLLASAHSYLDMKRHLAGYVGGCWRIPVVACQCWHMLLIYCVWGWVVRRRGGYVEVWVVEA